MLNFLASFLPQKGSIPIFSLLFHHIPTFHPCGFQVLYESTICKDYVDEVYPEYSLNTKKSLWQGKAEDSVGDMGKGNEMAFKLFDINLHLI